MCAENNHTMSGLYYADSNGDYSNGRDTNGDYANGDSSRRNGSSASFLNPSTSEPRGSTAHPAECDCHSRDYPPWTGEIHGMSQVSRGRGWERFMADERFDCQNGTHPSLYELHECHQFLGPSEQVREIACLLVDRPLRLHQLRHLHDGRGHSRVHSWPHRHLDDHSTRAKP